MGNAWRGWAAGLVLAGVVTAGCGGDDADDDAAPVTTTTIDIDAEPAGYILTGDDSAAPSTTVAGSADEAEIQGLTGSARDFFTLRNSVDARRKAGTTCGTTVMPPVPPLTLNRNLTAAAQRHADDMAKNDFFSHSGSDGSDVGKRVTMARYRWSWVGENIAAGTNTTTVAAAIEQLWLSEPHCKNFMSPNFTEWGTGQAFNAAAAYKNYFAFVLAKPQV